MNDAPDKATGELAADIGEFRTQLQPMLASLGMRDRIACVDTIMVLDHALEQLLLSLAANHPGVLTDDELCEIGRAIERLEIPLLQYIVTHSRADRRRHLDELVRRASSHRWMVEQIAGAVDGGKETATVLAEWESLCARRTLVTAADEIDIKLKKIDVVVGAARMGEETRATKFNDDLVHYADIVDETMQQGRNRLDALIQKAADENKEARKEIARIQEEVSGLLGDVVVNGISRGYEAAECRERRSAMSWRLFAVVVASLGAAQWALAWFAGSADLTWARVLVHLAATITCGGISAYAARQAAEHRREQRALRSDLLKMAASVIWMDRMTPETREEMQVTLARTFFRATETDKGDLSPEALSLLPVDKIMEIAKNVSKPKLTMEDAPSN